MKFSMHNKRSTKQIATLVILLAAATFLLGTAGNGRASSNEGSQIFLPMMQNNPRLAPVPELVSSISLEDAKCPYDMAYNRFSDLLYITNEDSKNISIIHDNAFAGHIATGKWPKFVRTDPHSDKVYISHVWDGIRVMQGSKITGIIPGTVESYWPTINSVNGYIYVTDLGRVISIIRDNKRVTDLAIPDYYGTVIKWQLTSDYDETNGLTYFPSWEHGILTVVDGLEVVDQFSYEGEGGIDMVIDSYRRLAIIANSRARADKDSPNNISIVDLESKSVKSIFSSKLSRHVALDPSTGYAYVTNPEDDSVTVLKGKSEVATYEVGSKPWGVAVDSITGLAYITNAGDNSVSVFRDGVPLATIELPEDMGFEPFQVTIDEETGRVFILNRSSKEKSVHPDTEATICREPWVHILQ